MTDYDQRAQDQIGILLGFTEADAKADIDEAMQTLPPEDLAVSVEDDLAIAIEPDEAKPALPAATPSTPFVELLPPDFQLPLLTRFVPNPQWKAEADAAAAYAESIAVVEAEGLQRADLALQVLRAKIRVIDDGFADPARISDLLHTRVTGTRAEWKARPQQVLTLVGQRIYTEQSRLKALADDARRKAQDEADRRAREAAAQEAAAAARSHAPAAIVAELKKQAETATAPPVPETTYAIPTLAGSTAVKTWKARLAGTSGEGEPHPAITTLSVAQRAQVVILLRAILERLDLLPFVEINWSYADARAKADKGTFAVPGLEAYESGSTRAKGGRRA